MPDVDVNSESLIPNSYEYYLVNIFKNTKFHLLFIVILSFQFMLLYLC